MPGSPREPDRVRATEICKTHYTIFVRFAVFVLFLVGFRG